MEWITKIDLGEARTQSEALKIAKDIITKWCKDNNCKGYLYKNASINNNKNGGRFIGITTSTGKWYVYQLIVSSIYKKVGEKQEKRLSLLTGFEEDEDEYYTAPVYDTNKTYFAHLRKPEFFSSVGDRKYNDDRNWELLNDIDPNIKMNKDSKSKYLGNIGDKITVDVKEMKLIYHKLVRSTWNTNTWAFVYKIIDTNNNVLIWTASNEVNTDDVNTITGTIKDLKDYEGEKQTVITRCKVN